MNKYEFAKMLNGREVGNEITAEENEIAKINNLMVIYGASDDLVEINGVGADEYGSGNTLYLTQKGVLTNDCDDPYCPYFNALIKTATASVTPVWCDLNVPISWTYKVTGVEVAKFLIKEGDTLFCEGIVIDLGDIS